MNLLNHWVCDCETYPNCFTVAVMRSDGKHSNVFECSEQKNDSERILKMMDWLHDNDGCMVGFNIINFDYPVLHELIQKRNIIPKTGKGIAAMMYRAAQKQIDSFKGDGFGNTVKEADRHFKLIDLYKIHHFDNKARATSLKMLEFNMREQNISDLPYPVGTNLSPEQIEVLKKYNLHDVKMTLAFYKKSQEQIRFREQLSAKYNRDFTNHNDTKIGKDYFIMRLEEEGIPTSIVKHGKKTLIQSKRPFIDIRDCLFSYYDFERPEFIAIVEWFKQQRITETKGVFTDILEHKLGDVAKYAEMVVKRKKLKSKPTEAEEKQLKKENPLCWVEEVELKAKETKANGGGFKKAYWHCWRVAETLNVVVDGFRFDFGTGGIHGSIESKVVKESENWKIRDYDVESFYPNMAISNRVYPEHLTEKFCDIYADVFNQRKMYKKGTAENAMMKLALNGVYGETNNQYSVFYDPKYTMTITVGGQLTLCLLVDMWMREGLKFKMIMANTDGVTIAVHKKHYEMCDAIAKKWEDIVKLKLESVDYSAMYIQNVNSYIAVYKE